MTEEKAPKPVRIGPKISKVGDPVKPVELPVAQLPRPSKDPQSKK